MPLRRSLLKLFAFLALSASIAVGVFVYTFDLDRYRLEIARRLAASIDRPVHLGEASLSLRPGLALSFADLRIGATGSGTDELSADHLFLLIDPWPLLKGEFNFREVILGAPRLTLTLDPAATAGSPAHSGSGRDLLETTLIRTLHIENGALRLRDHRNPGLPVAYEIRDIRGKVTDLSLDGPWRLDLFADLIQGENAAALTLAGEITPPPDLSQWIKARLDLHLGAQRLDPMPLLPAPAAGDTVKTDGSLSLQLDLNGVPASGLHLDGVLTGTDFSLHLPRLYRSPLSFHQAAIKSTWTAEADTHAFNDLSINVDGLALEGNLTVRGRQERPWLEGELSSSDLLLDEIRRFLPDRKSHLASLLKQNLSGGILRLDALRFAGYPEQFRRLDESFPVREGNFLVQNAAFRLDQQKSVTDIALAAAWKDRRLTLREGRGEVLGSPFDITGSLKFSEQRAPEAALSARGTAAAENLASLVPEEKLSGFLVSGPVPVTLEAVGTFDRLEVDLQADLQHLSARLADKFNKPPGLPGSLFITGEISPGHLDLSHSRLSIPPMELRARGRLDRTEERSFSLVLDIAPLDLRKARFRTPLLERFSPAGEIAAHYELEGSAGQIDRRGGTVFLRNFGIHLPGPVGDISRANGEIRLRENRAETSGLTALLGSSLLEAEGTLEDFSDPRLELWVRSPAIRADDLIFPSDRAVLRDVDGHLVITREGIDFAPVNVRLDGGTRATVGGTLRNFKAPETTLDITAEYGNIDEVIALWRRPEGALPKEHVKPRKTALFIDARVREGVLGPLHFQNARGEITLNEGVLNIFPLRFSAGSGTCMGQVVVDGSGSPPLLKISGHMENIDAAALHHELLKKRGLITGTLSGDFYLEGRAGSEFLPTSLGGFDLKVMDGVLLKFKFLSKVFSLLNVSQLLTLKLPDMDQKGMPFERVAGTFGLLGGVLSTEDLFIKSNAMNLSLVGDADLIGGKIDMILGVKPLRTVDKIITNIPVAGWLLTGEEKALITAHFHIKGRSEDPEVVPVPITSVSEKVLGVFKRVLGLPGKVIEDVGGILEGR
jgi:hypothetical protein